jgi:hypothetical protein
MGFLVVLSNARPVDYIDARMKPTERLPERRDASLSTSASPTLMKTDGRTTGPVVLASGQLLRSR